MLSPKNLFKFCIEGQACHAQCFLAQWRVPENLPYFQGHFPDFPILPAVATLDASIECLKQCLLLSELSVSVVKNAKFLAPITPGLEVDIRLHRQREKDWSIDWSLTQNSDQLLARMSFLL